MNNYVDPARHAYIAYAEVHSRYGVTMREWANLTRWEQWAWSVAVQAVVVHLCVQMEGFIKPSPEPAR